MEDLSLLRGILLTLQNNLSPNVNITSNSAGLATETTLNSIQGITSDILSKNTEIKNDTAINNERLLEILFNLRKQEGNNTYTSILATTSGSIATDKVSISFLTSSDFVGTINGVTRPADYSLSLQSEIGKKLPSISYTITSGNIIIDIIE